MHKSFELAQATNNWFPTPNPMRIRTLPAPPTKPSHVIVHLHRVTQRASRSLANLQSHLALRALFMTSRHKAVLYLPYLLAWDDKHQSQGKLISPSLLDQRKSLMIFSNLLRC